MLLDGAQQQIAKQSRVLAKRRREIVMLANFREAAQSAGVSLEVVHRLINVSSPNVNWQHEQFARKRKSLIAATLSSKPRPTPLYYASSIFDVSTPRSHQLASQVLARNIKIVAESLCKLIYNSNNAHKNLEVVSGSLGVNTNFVDSWLTYLGSQARVSGLATGKAPVVSDIEKALNLYTTEAKKTSFALESSFKLYKDSTTPTPISIHRVKPFTFDVYLCVAILAYLWVFHCYVKGVSLLEPVFGSKKKR